MTEAVKAVKLVKIGLTPYYLELISKHERLTGERPGTFARRIVCNELDARVRSGELVEAKQKAKTRKS